MATITRFEDLDVWAKARVLDRQLFELCKSSQLTSDFDLKRQLLRSSGSVMDNVAEGFERGGKGEFIQFLSIAKGSAGELRSQVIRAGDRGYLTEVMNKELIEKCQEISRMLQGFMDYLKESEMRGSKYYKKN